MSKSDVDLKSKKLKQAQLSFAPPKKKILNKEDEEDLENKENNTLDLNPENTELFNSNNNEVAKSNGLKIFNKNFANTNAKESSDVIVIDSSAGESDGTDTENSKRKISCSSEKVENISPVIIISSPTPVKKRRSIMEMLNKKALPKSPLSTESKEKNIMQTKTSCIKKQNNSINDCSVILADLQNETSVNKKKRTRAHSPKSNKNKNDESVVNERSENISDSIILLENESDTAPTPSKKIKQVEKDSNEEENNSSIILVESSMGSASTPLNSNSVRSKINSTEAIFMEQLSPSKDESMNDISMNDSSNADVSILSASSITINDSPENPTNKQAKKSVTKSKRISAEAEKRRKELERIKEEKRVQKEEEKLKREKEKLQKAQEKLELKLKREEVRRQKRELDEKIRQEKLKILEEQRLLKQEELLEKKREREQKELERKLERERREEKKKQKEEEKRIKEEEKKAKEEERILKLQQEQEEKERASQLKAKQATSFKSFFKTPPKSTPLKTVNVPKVGPFTNFQIKKGMSIAPTRRRVLNQHEKDLVIGSLEKQNSTKNYISSLKFGKKNCGKSEPTLPRSRIKMLSLSDDGLEVVNSEEENLQVSKGALIKAKLLLFHQNYRPPYYGTWRKKSRIISARNPFKKDEKLLDYGFDSDDEWEDPGEGEDIAESDGEEENDKDAEKEENDGFFVPHGYLSDDEGIEEDAEQNNSPVSHKMKQKQQEFEASFKRKIKQLKPEIIGPIWADSDEYSLYKSTLDMHKIHFIGQFPLQVNDVVDETSADSGVGIDNANVNNSASKSRIRSVPEEAMCDLIHLIHGNGISSGKIVSEFVLYWKQKTDGCLPQDKGPINDENAAKLQRNTESPVPMDSDRNKEQMSKSQLLKRIKEISTYTKLANWNRSCWVVKDEILKKYEMEEKVSIPNQWSYLTEFPEVKLQYIPPKQPSPPVVPLPQIESSPAPAALRIDKFVKKVSSKDILEMSKQKYEREKELLKSKPVPDISKYATDKLNPNELIQKSSEKLNLGEKAKEEDVMMGNQENEDPQINPECKYVVPTPDALRSLFGIKDDSENVDDKETAME